MRQGMARQVGYLQTRYKSIIKPTGDVLGIYLVNEGVLQGGRGITSFGQADHIVHIVDKMSVH